MALAQDDSSAVDWQEFPEGAHGHLRRRERIDQMRKPPGHEPGDINDATQRKDGAHLQTDGRETQIYRRVGNRWALVHAHYSEIPTAK